MINRAIQTGRLTKDPELRKTQSGMSVCNFILAVNRKYKKEGEPEADFINFQAWRSGADYLCNYAHKGDVIGVEGRIQTRNYKDYNDRTIYVTEVVCDSVEILHQANNVQNGANTYPQFQNATQSIYGDAKTNDFLGDTVDISSDDLPF